MDCLFCKISEGVIPAKIVFENERIVAFDDINPQAPTHIQIIPRKHIATVLEVAAEDRELIGEIIQTAAALARERGVADDGFRLVVNTNPAAGQSVYHLHVHLIGGRSLGWPPG
ncbi:MAG: histidine triad nucleotide-binding protein [Deltaproteobacteria bacterium]|nr:histidine triad nucleotide-binding protein [Myxococcales bacterium]MCZ6571476.1 histidine triad nucleotide-binding protein [Deltaproteobacteria bacterium]MCZ6712388.1 histidine triad nucleotide-binding protein [Deltaproteobacteria bacterium]MCZ6823687.1 histidine triad nucleotide-binding protein [Deltaproteobacteria bacterium]TDJ01571.1 MAG: histidine triad nucleotide-binding protein [Deltaproteobacteria bacterium]